LERYFEFKKSTKEASAEGIDDDKDENADADVDASMVDGGEDMEEEGHTKK
jgi:hypothetical protein